MVMKKDSEVLYRYGNRSNFDGGKCEIKLKQSKSIKDRRQMLYDSDRNSPCLLCHVPCLIPCFVTV